MSEHKRVLLIGLDGATWRLLEPLMARGWMPNLARLRAQGAWGVLESTIPPVTAPAWTTLQTGVLPGKHGILDFSQYVPGQYHTRLANSTDIPLPTIWQLVSNAGRRVISVNVPMTFPLRPVDGVAVGGIETPSLRSSFIYPHDLREQFLHANPDYQILVPQTEFNLHGLDRFLERSTTVERARMSAFLYLVDEVAPDWSLAMVHVQSTDIVQHAVYGWLDPSDTRFSSENYARIAQFYQAVDEGLARLVAQLMDERTLLVVLSDHGHGPEYKKVNMNLYLLQAGLQQVRGQGRARGPAFWLRGTMKWLLRLDRWNLNKALLPHRIRRRVGDRLVQDHTVDWERTTAYMINGWANAFVYVNVKGREPRGVVAQTEYDQVRTRVAEALSQLADPATGEPIAAQILCREEVFAGPYLDHMPDLVVVPKSGYEFTASVFQDSDEVVRPNRLGRDDMGSHTPDGIVLVAGSGVNSERLPQAHLVDLFPTVLAWLDIPIPAYSDGRVLQEAFVTPIRAVMDAAADVGQPTAPERQDYSPEEQRTMEERLRALGYM